MSRCCPHEDEKHQLLTTCQEVIHYPSEDYPCLCAALAADGSGKCAECGHKDTSHVVTRICTECGCSSAVRE